MSAVVRIWRSFVAANSVEYLEVETRPAPVLITGSTAIGVALLAAYVPWVSDWFGLGNPWPAIAVTVVACSASLGTWALLGRRPTVAYALQVVDYSGSAALPALPLVFSEPPGSYVFGVTYFVFVYNWATKAGVSLLLALIVCGVPLGISLAALASGLCDPGPLIVSVVGGASYVQLARNSEARRRLAARDEAQRAAVETVEQAVAMAYEAARAEAAAEVGAAMHELRNALVPAVSEVFLASEEPGLSEDGRAGLEEARAQIDRATALAESLVRALRADLKGRVEGFELAEALELLRGSRGASLASSGRALVVGPAPAVQVRGKPRMLGDVLSNLVANAFEAGAQSVEVASRLADGGIRARLEVRDDGPGVAAEVRERLFSPYATHGKAHGVGLGLYVARQVVEASGGSIEHAQREGGGATFAIELPVVAGSEQPCPG